MSDSNKPFMGKHKEQNVLERLYQFGAPATLSQLRAMMPTDTRQTVHALLAQLLQKGRVARREVNGAYVYWPTEAEKEAYRSYLDAAFQTFRKQDGLEILDDLKGFGFIDESDLKQALTSKPGRKHRRKKRKGGR